MIPVLAGALLIAAAAQVSAEPIGVVVDQAR
jgi:hypothetical protein